MEFIQKYLNEAEQVIKLLDKEKIRLIIEALVHVRAKGGRLFILGVGGSAANASHAVNDFRKIAGIEAYAPTDNVSELTARTNDDGFESVFNSWLQGSRLCDKDAIFILSVGGGNREKNVSVNLINAIDYAKSVNALVIGIAGKDGGYLAQNANVAVVIPVVNDNMITPHSESFQSVILHLIVSHPLLKSFQTKWESTR